MLTDYSPIKLIENEKKAQYLDLEIEPFISEVLKRRGIDKFYKFQTEAIKKIEENKNVLIMAPTASGKTECYLIPIIRNAIKSNTALVIYPTKALSQDQLNRFKEFSMYGIKAEVYDGDTPAHIREKIRKNPPHVLITNFDMLHFILLNNKLWSEFFAKLKIVVIDEVHSYSGIFGCHVANIIWRLERIIEHYKKQKDIQYILSSASIGNPKEFCNCLFENKNFEIINADSAPRSKIEHYIVNYPDESLVTTSIKIARELNKKTIIFGNSHNIVERIAYSSKEMDFPIEVYRAGLDLKQRRKIEKEFNEGKINCIASTSALELGVDIKDAEVCILAGFPGSITKTKQRMGRVGRKTTQAKVIFVAKQSPLDQYYATNPEQYLNGEYENCYVNKYNEAIREMALVCAAKDLPLQKKEVQDETEIINKLVDKGFISEFRDYYFTTKKGYAAIRDISLRGTNNKIEIFDYETGKYLGERETSIGLGELYEDAIYLLGGEPYSVKELKLEQKKAYIQKIKNQIDLYTQAIKTKEIDIIEQIQEHKIKSLILRYGKLHVSTMVLGYKLKEIYSGKTINNYYFQQPLTYSYNTEGFWVDLSKYIKPEQEYLDGLHALEHMSIAMMPAISGVDAAEIGGLSQPNGLIIYYEGIEGGSGATVPIIKQYDKVLKMSLDRLTKCECLNGCPKCIYSPQCGNDNNYLNKNKAIEIVKNIINELGI